MRYALLAIFVCFLTCAHGQNIVPNANFAAHTQCPDFLDSIQKCSGWTRPTEGSSDYFNACNDTMTATHYLLSVPTNFAGSQSSASNAYTGIITYASTIEDQKEYITTTIPALEATARYKVTVVVSLADRSQYATNGLGVFFYKEAKPDSTGVYSTIPVTPQIDYSAYGVMNDKTAWTTLTDTFIADSAYTHLVVGNFRNDGSLTVTPMPGPGMPYAYYYIDSVAVEKVAPASLVRQVSVDETMKIFPNPATDRLGIYIAPGQGRLLLRDIIGKVMIERNISGANTYLDISALPRGVYFVQWHHDGLTETQKVTLQ